MAQLVASVISIHAPALPDPYCISHESASLVWLSINHLNIVPVITWHFRCICGPWLQTCCIYLLPFSFLLQWRLL